MENEIWTAIAKRKGEGNMPDIRDPVAENIDFYITVIFTISEKGLKVSQTRLFP